MAQKQKGVVKWYNTKKGFGFITCDDGSGDAFVHFSEIKGQGFKSLGDGEEVEFNVVTQEDGRRKAIDVTGPDGAFVIGAEKSMDIDAEGKHHETVLLFYSNFKSQQSSI